MTDLTHLSISQLARLCAFLEGAPRATIRSLAYGQARGGRGLARRGIGLDDAIAMAGIEVVTPGPVSMDELPVLDLDELFSGTPPGA